MAKIENLFVGCPVQIKDTGELATVVAVNIDDDDGGVYLILTGDVDILWDKADELRLAPFPEPDKIKAHLERFDQ